MLEGFLLLLLRLKYETFFAERALMKFTGILQSSGKLLGIVMLSTDLICFKRFSNSMKSSICGSISSSSPSI